ncbi:hypothetical protein I4J43_02325 [Corynebacterium belfantii]|uniref:hypothetical protein n=1 Tax=Corynebacterium belfantii TaxID=2014537 RepID=UPI0018D4C49F|nr:hypothetical protein [Corynebacterium belfantii]MBG9243103.1 hypothetical protein [Corynebacterium belfantii]MBG9332915.1 hypothetical protein [Corynebacterium belfantii]
MVTSRFRLWLHSMQWYSAIVVMVSLLFAGTGVVWAWFRPTYSAEIVEDNQVRVGTEVNVEFLSLAQFIVISGILSLAITYIFARKVRSHNHQVRIMMWLLLWTLIGGLILAATGYMVASLIHHTTDADQLLPGTVIRFAPPVALGANAVMWPPFVAGCAFWLSLFINIDDESDDDNVSADNRNADS